MVFAHGIGGSQDLPISLPFALAVGVAALAVSFIVLALAWRQPRYDAATLGRPAPAWFVGVVDSGWFSAVLRIPGLVFAGYVAWAALAGPDNVVNPTFGVVYVLLWVGLVRASLLSGPFYRAVNPVRTLHWLPSRATGGSPSRGVSTLPSWWGCGPRRSACSPSSGSSSSPPTSPSCGPCASGSLPTSRSGGYCSPRTPASARCS